MTAPLPGGARAAGSAPRSPEERRRARVRLARKWAYLLSEDNYVPHSHVELEQAMTELVGSLFTAVAADPVDVGAAVAVGARLVELNCTSDASVVSTLEVLTTAVLRDQDTLRLDRLPERVGRVLGGLVSGLTGAARLAVLDQQNGMCRTLGSIARKALADAEAGKAEVYELSTELSLLRGRLGYQLLHDALTGLANRQFFVSRLEQALGMGRPVTLFRLELTGFDLINEGLGRLAAESWLNAAADRLHRVVADRVALVARFEGVNFALLQESAMSTSDMGTLVERVNEALAEPTYLDGVGLATAASVGVVQSPPHRVHADALLHAAELALRAAKDAGPERWVLRAPEADVAERRALRLAVGMPGAWETGQLGVGYELRVGLADERPVGVHAFLRWREPEWGRPGVELAERTGMTSRLDRWLLRELRGWSDVDLVLAVSLSPSQSAAPDLVDAVYGVIEESGLRPGRLRVAMPVGEVCGGRAQAADNLRLITAIGVGAAVYGFDGGAGELIQLADLPVREVWLGRGLVGQVRRTGWGSLAADTVGGVVGLVHRAGVVVGVGDVRDRAEADWWRRAGVDVAAGPLFSPSVAGADIADLFG